MGSPSSPVSEITLLNETGVFPGVAGCLFLAFFGGALRWGDAQLAGQLTFPVAPPQSATEPFPQKHGASQLKASGQPAATCARV